MPVLGQQDHPVRNGWMPLGGLHEQRQVERIGVQPGGQDGFSSSEFTNARS